jgi:hypothetical protein
MPASFRALAELCEKLEGMKKRTLMISLVSDFLKTLEPEEVEPAVSMILGRALSKHSEHALEVSWATLSEIIRRITGVDWKVFTDTFSKTGDIGAATKILFESSGVKRQLSLFEKVLTINDVRKSFEAIAEAVGPGSREKKERLLEALLVLHRPLKPNIWSK